MYQYRLFERSMIGLRRIVMILGLILAFFIITEMSRITLVLYRIQPVASAAFVILVLVLLLYVVMRWMMFRSDHRTLSTGPFVPLHRAGHKDLKRHLKYLSKYLKRMANATALDDDDTLHIRQHAQEIDDLLGAHPLNEDLQHMIQRTEAEIIEPVMGVLDHKCRDLARKRMMAIIEDRFEPPFPVPGPLLLLYHQVTLISSITDLYVPHPALFEYARVIKDTWDVMTKGDFLRLGQKLFEGIYRNAPPLGRTSDDLGETLAAIWVTGAISEAAGQRCRTLHGWNLKQAIDQMDESVIPLLQVTREIILKDAIPLLKVRIRHNAPHDSADTGEFTETIIKGVTKAIDGVVTGVTRKPASPDSPPPLAQRRSTPTGPVFRSEHSEEHHHRHRRKRRRHKKRESSAGRIVGLFLQKLRYGRGAPRS